MAKVTWLGEDKGSQAGPSFTTAFGGIKFPKGEAVEVTDPDIIKKAKGNHFFKVEGTPGRPPKAKPDTDEAKVKPDGDEDQG